jgi:hypothetical protein
LTIKRLSVGVVKNKELARPAVFARFAEFESLSKLDEPHWMKHAFKIIVHEMEEMIRKDSEKFIPLKMSEMREPRPYGGLTSFRDSAS